MAYRIHDSVIRGEIDNTVRGVVKGKIWRVGHDEPIVLDLAGDCWRDLAGRRCSFVNPNPVKDKYDGLQNLQTGEVGDITASRKVRVPDLPLDEWLERKRQGLEAPEHWGNALYLEWYSDANGRVVVESADYELEVSLPEWEMTEEDERRQREINAEGMQRFLNRLESALRDGPPVEVPEEREMDEFEWERFLKESDARTERYGELLDKFKDHPDQERIVARHMGWDWLDEALSESPENTPESKKDAAEPEAWDIPDLDEMSEPEPNPETEGVDWIRTEGGFVKHPLQHRCHELGMRMFFDAKERGLDNPFSEDADPDVADMVFYVQRTAVKMAGALSSIATGFSMPDGFVVATLKRAMGFLHEALGKMDKVESRKLLADKIPEYREELLQIRSDLIDLMARFRY